MRAIIPAYHATHTLPGCIQALVRSGFKGEIVVVDDGGNGDLQTLLAPYPVQIIRTSGSIGAAAARNCGAAGYSGDILIFIDADVEVEQNSIEQLTTPIYRCLSEATVGNYSRDTSGMSFAQKYKQLYVSHIYSRRSGYIQNEFWTALGAIRADIFSELGGFRSLAGPGEDTELGCRLSQQGRRILAVPEARAKHLKRYTFRTLILNDLQKGIRVTSLFFEAGKRLSNYRHSSRRDILAVALAYGLLVFCAILWLLPLPIAALLAATGTAAYLLARLDLLAIYSGSGLIFLAQSLCMMFILDIVRGLCIIIGLSKGLSRYVRMQHSWHGGR